MTTTNRPAKRELPPGITDLATLNVQQLDAMLARKLLAVMRKIERIEKDATNPHHKYRYASEQAIKEACHPIMAEEGLLFGLECSHDRPPIVYDLANGNAQLLLPIFYVFTDGDTGHSKRVEWYGTGHVRDDKGLYGAMTGALKYALTTSLLIPTGDDPEASDDPAPASRQQSSQQPRTTRPAPAGQPARTAAPEPSGAKMPPATAGLRCISCGYVATAGDVKVSVAKFDGRKGQVMAGEKAYFCPGDGCELFQSVHGAGVNHSKTTQATTAATTAGREGTVPDPALEKHLAQRQLDEKAKAEEEPPHPADDDLPF